MSLRRALVALPGDRDTRATLRGVVGYLDAHRREPVDAGRIARIAGFSEGRVGLVMQALAEAFVIDCDGDPRSANCTYSPDSMLDLEVRRFLRSSGSATTDLQRGVSRFRDRYGTGH